MIYHTIETELEKAHKDYTRRKKQTLTNLVNIKECYKKLYINDNISKDTYFGLLRIANNTIKFINEKEI